MLDKLLERMENNYCFKYDPEINTFVRTKDGYCSRMVFKELILITEILSANNIDFIVDAEENITINEQTA